MDIGEDTSFECFYVGTTDLSVWAINRSFYITHFPPRHSREGYNLTVHDVQGVDNGTTYQCIVFDRSSAVGTLTVKGNFLKLNVY